VCFVLYLAFIFSYHSQWARAEFPRFAIPILPFVLVGFGDLLPSNLYLLWGCAPVCGVLASCSALGLRNLLRM